MQALTDAIKRRHPGVVIYGIGDAAHQLHSSDHNEDDTAGSRAAQSDPDSNPEHRAIDVMLGPAFSKTDADKLVNDLITDPTSRARLYNIIWNGSIWSRSWGWTRRDFGGDPHRDHPHIAGLASDDENGAGWPAIDGEERSDMIGLRYGDTGEEVKALQYTLEAAGHDVGEVDGGYGDKTAAAVKACCGGVDGRFFAGIHYSRLLVALATKYGPAAAPAPAPAPGLTLPATVTITGVIAPAA